MRGAVGSGCVYSGLAILLFFSLILHLCFKFWTPEREAFLVTKHLQFILSLGFFYVNVDSQFFISILFLLGIFISRCLTNDSPVFGFKASSGRDHISSFCKYWRFVSSLAGFWSVIFFFSKLDRRRPTNIMHPRRVRWIVCLGLSFWGLTPCTFF